MLKNAFQIVTIFLVEGMKHTLRCAAITAV